MTFVSDLEPKELWKHFDQILTLPRGSKNEEAAAGYVISVAERHRLGYKRDDAGNVLVRKPGTRGRESKPITILQCHLDMVNEKNAEVDHDFSKDPLQPLREGDYLKATGTTLGSDNGIGIAASLALIESTSMAHGPLECLFTVDEETGLTGAGSLQPGFLEGRQLINLDTEEEGALYVGCAGGAGVNLTLPLEHRNWPAHLTAVAVKLHGLRGGHSGVDIHLQRGNAVKLLARALEGAQGRLELGLASLVGGNMHNAIPREAFARVGLAEADKVAFEEGIQGEFQAIREEFKPADPGMTWSIESAPIPDTLLEERSARTVLWLLNALPHGVMSMSYDIPDLVETSSNLATVALDRDQLLVHISNRSSVETALSALQVRVASIGHLAGAQVEFLEGYPGWKPNLDSHLLKVAEGVFKRHLGRDPEVKAVHAGLECGIIGEKYPGMDMLSLGPQIEFPHSPDERVRIGSVSDFYQLLSAILEELAG
ncbi:MAG: aminoacyl-histidine dipeptidase [Acidobacteriota bacterium]